MICRINGILIALLQDDFIGAHRNDACISNDFTSSQLKCGFTRFKAFKPSTLFAGNNKTLFDEIFLRVRARIYLFMCKWEKRSFEKIQ